MNLDYISTYGLIDELVDDFEVWEYYFFDESAELAFKIIGMIISFSVVTVLMKVCL